MIHTYRVALIAGYWRIMRDDVLHSTYATRTAALAGIKIEQQRDKNNKTYISPDRAAYSMNELLARLWQDAAHSSQYSLSLWEEFKDRFDDLYARAYAARKGE